MALVSNGDNSMRNALTIGRGGVRQRRRPDGPGGGTGLLCFLRRAELWQVGA